MYIFNLKSIINIMYILIINKHLPIIGEMIIDFCFNNHCYYIINGMNNFNLREIIILDIYFITVNML